MIAVADAGPLLALAKVNALDLLTQLFQQVFATPTVFTEVVTAGLAQNAPDAGALDAAFRAGRLQVRPPKLTALPRPALVHRGEEESICLAIELAADWLLLDDLDARRTAQENLVAAGVSTSIKGTLGVIVAAYQQHQLAREQAVDRVNALKAHPDIWISKSLCDQVIRILQRS